MEAFGQSVDQNCKINRRIYTDRHPQMAWLPDYVYLCVFTICLYSISLRINMSIWKHSSWKH